MPPLGGMQIRHHCQAKAATGKGEDFHVSHPDCVWPGDRSDAASLGLCGAPVHFALFGVFDGHGGQATGKHCRDAQRTAPPSILWGSGTNSNSQAMW